MGPQVKSIKLFKPTAIRAKNMKPEGCTLRNDHSMPKRSENPLFDDLSEDESTTYEPIPILLDDEENDSTCEFEFEF